jgi:hypothetical protein
MSGFTNTLRMGVLAAIAVSGVAVSTTPASAAVACNRFNECWHTNTRYTTYPSHLGVKFYEDNWREKHRRGHRWRADPRDDHGYYSHGRWRSF